MIFHLSFWYALAGIFICITWADFFVRVDKRKAGESSSTHTCIQTLLIHAFCAFVNAHPLRVPSFNAALALWTCCVYTAFIMTVFFLLITVIFWMYTSPEDLTSPMFVSIFIDFLIILHFHEWLLDISSFCLLCQFW